MMSIATSLLITGNQGEDGMRHRVSPRWLSLVVPLFVLCACSPPTRYENTSHANYGASEFSADLAQCRSRSATSVVSTRGYDVWSGVGVDEVQVNACMAAQGWQQAPPSVIGTAAL
jgi:hypothetical protein